MAEKLVIIGSGPAGYTAALYASRAELAPVLFEGMTPGGQLMLTTEVENYPGFPKGILGPEMMQLFRVQAERFGTKIIQEEVSEVNFSHRPFIVKTAKQQVEAESVIVSTGATAIWLGIPGEKEYQGHGVSACATCDGFFFKGKDIVVVGGGDAAMEEANFLTKFANKVTVMVRKDVLRASRIMQERAKKNPKISFMWNTEVEEVVGDGQPGGAGSGSAGKMTGLKIKNNQSGKTAEFGSQGLFVAIGHKPNTELFVGKLELDQKGYVVTKSGSTATNIEGVFAAGDLADHKYRQAVTAAGTGCMAALDAERWLTANE